MVVSKNAKLYIENICHHFSLFFILTMQYFLKICFWTGLNETFKSAKKINWRQLQNCISYAVLWNCILYLLSIRFHNSYFLHFWWFFPYPKIDIQETWLLMLRADLCLQAEAIIVLFYILKLERRYKKLFLCSLVQWLVSSNFI